MWWVSDYTIWHNWHEIWSESGKDYITVSSGTYKKGSFDISLSKSSTNWHYIKMTKIKTNGDLLSKKKILEEYGDVFDTLGCLPGELYLEVDKSIWPVQQVPWKIPVAMKEEIMTKIDKLIEHKIAAWLNEPTEWIHSMFVVKILEQQTLCLY